MEKGQTKSLLCKSSAGARFSDHWVRNCAVAATAQGRTAGFTRVFRR